VKEAQKCHVAEIRYFRWLRLTLAGRCRHLCPLDAAMPLPPERTLFENAHEHQAAPALR